MSTIADRLLKSITAKGYSYGELAKITGFPKSAIQRYATGQTPKIPVDRLERLADVLGVSAAYLMGWEEQVQPPEQPCVTIPPGFEPPPEMVKVPLVGAIACGEPITAEENLEGYVDAPKSVHCDFALRCEGDSMIDAGISEGDIVFIRQQPEVPNGQIAAVRIGDEATLKRVYWDGTTLTLMPANPCYAPRPFTGEQLRDVQIEGRAIGYLHLY